MTASEMTCFVPNNAPCELDKTQSSRILVDIVDGHVEEVYCDDPESVQVIIHDGGRFLKYRTLIQKMKTHRFCICESDSAWDGKIWFLFDKNSSSDPICARSFVEAYSMLQQRFGDMVPAQHELLEQETPNGLLYYDINIDVPMMFKGANHV